MEQTIMELIARACADSALTSDADRELLDSGLLDSLAIITLLSDLDDELGLEVQPTQLTRDDWRTPRAITAAIRRLHPW